MNKFLVLRLVYSGEFDEAPAEFRVRFHDETPHIGATIHLVAPNGHHFGQVKVIDHRHLVHFHTEPDGTTSKIEIVCELPIENQKTRDYYHTWMDLSGFFTIGCH